MDAYEAALEKQLIDLPRRFYATRNKLRACAWISFALGAYAGYTLRNDKFEGLIALLLLWGVGWLICRKLSARQVEILHEYAQEEIKIRHCLIAVKAGRKLEQSMIRVTFMDKHVHTLRPSGRKELIAYVGGIDLVTSVSPHLISSEQRNFDAEFVIGSVFDIDHCRGRIEYEADCHLEEGTTIDYLVDHYQDNEAMIEESGAKLRRHLREVISKKQLKLHQIKTIFLNLSINLPNSKVKAKITKMVVIHA